jgi:hypothetical protein
MQPLKMTPFSGISERIRGRLAWAVFLQRSVAICARPGTSDPDNCYPASKLKLTFDLTAAGP